MPGTSVELESVRVTRGASIAVEGATLRVAAGERVFLLGPNGAGKTSLLLAIVGAVPFEGEIRVGGVRVEKRSLARVRKDVGFVFADPSDQFFLHDVEEEVAFGPRERGLPDTEVKARVLRALGSVGLTHLRERAPDALSLGEQRRLAVATALAIEPGVLLFDEPTASLDPRARRALLEVVRGVPSTVVVATHDLDAALALEGRAVLLSAGRIVAEGPAEELLVNEDLLDSAGLALPLSVAARR